MFWKRRQFFGFLGALLGGTVIGPQDASGESVPAQTPETDPRPGRQHAPDAQAFHDPEAIHEQYDLVVVGGGIAGTCAAVSAARNGVRVALVHERAMLGGNSSSEVKLYPENSSGHQAWIKEMGIFEEIHVEERVRNHSEYREGTMNSIWDLTLYEWVLREPNITLFLNTHMHRVMMRDAQTIDAVYCIQLGSERTYVLHGTQFVDSTGDGVLAHKAGADYRWGREARSEYGESMAQEAADERHMGSTLFFRALDTGKPVPFKRPSWAASFDSEAEFQGRSHTRIDGGYWWVEVGAPYHPIHDNNAIIHEGLRQLLGVWDHIKNHCPLQEGRADTYGLDFVGFWPYKRECRRILGDYVLTQEHLQNPQLLEDGVAYGVWFIDIHTHGILDRDHLPYPPPYADENWDQHGTRCYGIPLRALYSRNVNNLLMAGRPISASYVAFSSTRVLMTGAIVGQAVGAAAALCKKYAASPREVARKHARECQQLLLRQDAYLPGVANQDPADLARSATASASSHAPLVFPGPGGQEEELRLPVGQIFPVSSGRLDQVALWLRSALDHDVTLRVALRPAAHVWDFRGDTDLAEAHAVVPAGSSGWVTFPLAAEVPEECCYYIYTSAQPGIFWQMYQETDDNMGSGPAGVCAATFPGSQYWRPIRDARFLCMRVLPESRPFTPQNVLRGANRPDMWTNLWASDPAAPLPAWIQLDWPRAVRFNRLQLTFDTNMNRRSRLPLFRYPECVRDYRVEYGRGNRWTTLFEERDNYMRRRVHDFDTVTANRLRLTVLGTNGAPNARVYEVRVYDEA